MRPWHSAARQWRDPRTSLAASSSSVNFNTLAACVPGPVGPETPGCIGTRHGCIGTRHGCIGTRHGCIGTRDARTPAAFGRGGGTLHSVGRTSMQRQSAPAFSASKAFRGCRGWSIERVSLHTEAGVESVYARAYTGVESGIHWSAGVEAGVDTGVESGIHSSVEAGPYLLHNSAPAKLSEGT